MSHILAQNCTHPAARPSLMSWVRTLIGTARSRRALAKLSPEQLADIGISRSEAAAEAGRPLWDVPAHWRK